MGPCIEGISNKMQRYTLYCVCCEVRTELYFVKQSSILQGQCKNKDECLLVSQQVDGG
jgi:hypothetical protein